MQVKTISTVILSLMSIYTLGSEPCLVNIKNLKMKDEKINLKIQKIIIEKGFKIVDAVEHGTYVMESQNSTLCFGDFWSPTYNCLYDFDIYKYNNGISKSGLSFSNDTLRTDIVGNYQYSETNMFFTGIDGVGTMLKGFKKKMPTCDELKDQAAKKEKIRESFYSYDDFLRDRNGLIDNCKKEIPLTRGLKEYFEDVTRKITDKYDVNEINTILNSCKFE